MNTLAWIIHLQVGSTRSRSWPAALLALVFLCSPSWAEPRLDRYGDPLPYGAVARLGTNRLRPGEPNCSFAISADGTLLATGEEDWVRLWSLADGKEVRSIHLPKTRKIYEIHIAPDGKWLTVRADDPDLEEVPDYYDDDFIVHQENFYICDINSGAIVYKEKVGASLCVRFVCAGKMLALHQSALYYSRPGTVRLWDTAKQRETSRLVDIRSFDASPDGKVLATGGDDGVIRLWDPASGGEIRSIEAHLDGVRAIAVSPDGKWVASVGGPRPRTRKLPVLGDDPDRTVRVWDVATGRLVRFLQPPPTFVTRLRFSPDGQTLLGENDLGGVTWWSVRTNAVLRRFDPLDSVELKQGFRIPLEFSPDGRMLAVSRDRHEVRFYDTADGTELRRWPEDDAIADLQFTPDGKTLIMGGAYLRFRDVDTARDRYAFVGHRQSVYNLNFAPDGRFLSSSDVGGGERIWSTDGLPLALPDIQKSRIIEYYFKADGNELVTVDIHGTVRVNQLPSGREIRRFGVAPPWSSGGHYHYGGVFGPGGRTLVDVAMDGKLDIYDVATGRRAAQCTARHFSHARLAFTPDGRSLVSQDADRTLHLWATTSGAELAQIIREHPLKESRFDVTPFSLSPDGRLLAWGPDGDGHLLDANTGKEIRKMPEWHDGVIDRDGRMLIGKVNESQDLQICDLESGMEVRRVSMSSRADQFRFAHLFSTPDGRALAYVGQESMQGAIETSLRDARTGRELCDLRYRHAHFALSQDGRFLATAGDAIILREVASGRELGRFPIGHRGSIVSLAFSPDGHTLATGGSDGVILLWDLDTALGPSQIPHRAWLGLRDWTRTAEQRRELLWQDLAADARTAQRAVAALVAEGDDGLAFVSRGLRTLRDEDDTLQQRLSALLRELDSEDFAERQRASAALAEIGVDGEPFLRRALRGRLDVEVHSRVQTVLGDLRLTQPTTAALRRIRAIQILEGIGSPEARRLLGKLAEGQPDRVLTEEARVALVNLERRHTGR